MPSIKVEEVKGWSGKGKFINFPWSLPDYLNDKNWVPPLKAENRIRMSERLNPFFKHAKAKYFMAHKDGKAVGRISAHVAERFNEFQKNNWGFFGWFESIDDPEVAGALFDRAEAQLKEWGMTSSIGPLNYTVNDECGLLIDGFDTPPMILMTHNPPYYQRLIEGAGYAKAQDLFAYRLDATAEPPAGIVAIAEQIRKRPDVKFRSWDLKKNLRNELIAFHEIYNAAWNRNWGFCPIDRDEILSREFEFRYLLDKEVAFFAEVGGKPIAFSLSLPNINECIQLMNGSLNPVSIWKFFKKLKKIEGLRVFALGVMPEHRKMGVGAVFYVDTLIVARNRGYKWGEMSWILESNGPMNRAIQAMGGTVYKTYRVFKKDLA